MNRSLLLFALLAACAPSEEKFQDRFAESACEVMLECAEDGSDSGFSLVLFENQEQCESFYSLAWGFMGECEYDKKAAKECLKGLDDLSCDGTMEGSSACDDVYTGAACGWSGESGGDSGWDSGW
jgi:hypothetical protein